MRVAIYARISTNDQNTIPMQIKKCSEYAKARGWTVSHIIKDIASGAKQRPQLEDTSPPPPPPPPQAHNTKISNPKILVFITFI
jgi:hypothetical protein